MRLLGPLPADVIEVVSEMTGIHVEAIVGSSQRKQVMQARQLAYLCCRSSTSASWAEIAIAFGKSHHQSIISVVHHAETDPSVVALAMEVAEIVREKFGFSPSNQQGRRAEVEA